MIKCSRCKKYNHYASLCKNTGAVHQLDESSNADTDSDSSGIAYLDEIKEIPLMEVRPSNESVNEWHQEVYLENICVNFKLDIGAAVNVIPLSVYEKLSTKQELKPPSKFIRAYGGTIIKPVGEISLISSVKNRTARFKYLVVKQDTTALLSLKACVELNLVKRVDSVSTNQQKAEENDFIKKNKTLVEGLGKFPGKQKINIVENAQLPNVPPRRIPSSLKRGVKRALDRLARKGIIEKVNKPTAQHCINHLVVVEKDDKNLRLCLDPRELNGLIITQHHLLPTISEIAEKLKYNKYFTVLDLKDGYHQIELDEDSSNLCCFATPFGIYKYKRLPFGLTCSSEIFQGRMEEEFGDIPNVMVFQDDILIHAKTEEEHDRALKEVMLRAKKLNIKFNLDKLQYKKSAVRYVGFIYDKDGRHIDHQRIEALLALDPPTTKKKLQKCMGMFNYIRDFIPDMSAVTAPLRELLKDNVHFQWLPSHDQAFAKLKALVVQAPVLANFDPKKQI